jgi:nicotinamide riboside kinase
MTIAFTGPESTGKTFLAKRISHIYEGNYLGEFARIYFENNAISISYTSFDILNILNGHLDQMSKVKKLKPSLIVMDTEVLVLKVWCSYKFGVTLPELEMAWEDQNVDLYLLCYPDIPWVHDPLRENPFDRHILFEEYLSLLEDSKRNFHIIKGQGEERFENTLQILSSYL